MVSGYFPGRHLGASVSRIRVVSVCWRHDQWAVAQIAMAPHVGAVGQHGDLLSDDDGIRSGGRVARGQRLRTGRCRCLLVPSKRVSQKLKVELVGFWDAEWLTAAGGVIIGVLGLLLSRRKSKFPEPKPSIHQEVVRPETSAEIKSAEALKSIAGSLLKLERNVDLYLDRQRNK